MHADYIMTLLVVHDRRMLSITSFDMVVIALLFCPAPLLIGLARLVVAPDGDEDDGFSGDLGGVTEAGARSGDVALFLVLF